MKLTYCTTCRGRLPHLRKTYPDNLREGLRHPGVSFVLLDYGDTDGMKEWVLEELKGHMGRGSVTVYSFHESCVPLYYDSSHAKNVSSLLAPDGIICNLDADNTLHPNFTQRMLTEFSKDRKIVAQGRRDAAGRVAIMKDILIALGGYYEKLIGYGYDDVDLVRRAENLGGIRRLDLPQYDLYIRHSDEERGRYMKVKDAKATAKANLKMLQENQGRRRIRPNNGYWGVAKLYKNYTDQIVTTGAY